MVPETFSRRRVALAAFGLLAGVTAAPFVGTYAGHLGTYVARSFDPWVADSRLADDGSVLALEVGFDNHSHVPIRISYTRIAGFLDGELVTSWNGSRVEDITIEPGTEALATVTIPVQAENRETVEAALADASLTVSGVFDVSVREEVVRKTVVFEGVGDE